jgi:hypothetical protein
VSLHVGYFDAMSIVLLILGEILEKATRVLTDEDKALLDKDFVGKNGQRRKLEVSVPPPHICTFQSNILHTAYHGSSKTEEILPI